MWYEVLPAFGVMCMAMFLAGKGVGAVQRYQYGGRPRRIMQDMFSKDLEERDKILTGNVYTQQV